MIKKLQSGFIFLLLSTALFSQDQVFNTDVIVQGSMQIGESAQNGYSFGFNTFVMSEDNLRMLFNDTSGSGSSPSNDWRFTFNDSSDSGDNYFSIDDATGRKKPFRIDAGAPNDAFRIADNGNIGIGETEEGLMVYDTEEKVLYFWNGTEWSSVIKDNLGDHTATTMLNMADNVIRFDNGEVNGIEFNGGDQYKIAYRESANYGYEPVTGVSIKTSMSASANNGWTWGPYNAAPVTAISTERKMQIA